jgi:hypothetical protein
MIHTVDPRQNRLFDPFDGVIPPVGRRIIADGWQGVFRQVLLEVMPVAELSSHFSDSMGAPTKELYSMAGMVFLADVFSHMATFGRTKLMAVAIKRFLTQFQRHDPDADAALPEDLRLRYAPAQARLFADAKDSQARARCRQQAADDLCFIIDRFADRPDLANRSTSKALITIFDQQCERRGDKVVVKAKTGGDCVQNPSDLDATYDGHKGPGYQVQIAETCVPSNEVQLITAALPETACDPDAAAVPPMLDQLAHAGRLPEELLADTLDTSDENVQAAEVRGVDLIGPVPGRAPESTAETLTADDFAVDERTGVVDACPAGHRPTSCSRDAETTRTRVEMPASACAACPFRKQCPIEQTRDGKFTMEFTDKERRLAGRRVEEATDVFQQRYAVRLGIESTHSGLKNLLGLGHLSVRGMGSVSRVILHKLAGWNVLRASASKKLKAWVASRVAETLGAGGLGRSGGLFSHVWRLAGRGRGVFRCLGRPVRRSEFMLAA